MAVGDEARAAVQSYVAVGRETTFGSYASATTAVEVLSCGFRTERTSQKLDEIGLHRGFTRRVFLDKKVAGTLEAHLHPHETVLLLANALGGGIVSTVTSGVATHSMTAGNFDTIAASLSFNVRKGANHSFRYLGGRINQLRISAKAGESVRVAADLIFADSTLLSDDISAILSYSSLLPMTYAQGVYRYSTTEALANTTTAEEAIQGFDLTINNNLKADSDAMELGSHILSVLPPTRRDVALTVTQRWDTSTAFNRFIQATQGAIELVFTGATITTGSNHMMTFRFPKVFMQTTDPRITGAGDLLMSEIAFDCVVDSPSTATGREIGVTVINDVSAY